MHQAKILVADDSRTMRTIVFRTLSTAGFDISLAGDGKEAVAVAQRDLPDLAILDIQMPEMDGYTACEHILELKELPDSIPIIFLTKETANHLHALGAQLGAYLQKPVDDEKLLATVCELLGSQATAATCAGACG